jgi:hypothetical protein
LLRRLLLWTSSTSVLSGVLATNNSGLINRAKTQSLLKYSVPNTTSQPDWDIVEAIVRTVSQSKLVVTYKYVRGHQDEKTAYELLPFLAQLNVDADTYTGRYQRAYGSHRPIIPLSPTRPIALDLSGRTIHQNMKSEIRDAAHAIPLLNRMIKQKNWTPQVINLIHWDAHRLATSGAHRLRKTHFVKLCHGYLPAGKIAHRNNPSFPGSCPLCQSPAEDHCHILQCPHPSRVEWRKALETTLSKTCESLKTDPVLKSILLNGMKCWLCQVQFDDGGIPFQYHALLQAQHDIGWYNVFLAQFATQWAHCQSLFLSTLPTPTKSLSGDKWVSAISTAITKAWLELWELCNKDRHGSDSHFQSAALHAQAVCEITILYSYQNTVLQKDRSIFTTDLHELSAGNTNHIRQWINTHQAVILKSIKSAKTNAVLNVRTITTYFPIQGSINR